MKRNRLYPILNIAVQLAALTPALWLGGLLAFNQLGANPIQTLEQRSGDIALILLLVTLACTPARLISGYAPFNRLRRTLGLYSFGYAAVHLLLFIGLDYGFMWAELWTILQQKTYIWFGLSGFLILSALAITSSIFWQKKLKKNWQRLHSLIYLAGPLVILHFALSLKGNIFLLSGNVIWPLIALSVFIALMLFRIKKIKRWIANLDKKEPSSQVKS
ncbi:MAG: protein-methionine-sulfoxide reductase heme-binding subunit MsrQ [Anaerolineaceae bacterium]|nr:protein-methionine-sulfoxide reductase heme-binding subunit MsrQ [Anaerolineaceae bacterium]